MKNVLVHCDDIRQNSKQFKKITDKKINLKELKISKKLINE